MATKYFKKYFIFTTFAVSLFLFLFPQIYHLSSFDRSINDDALSVSDHKCPVKKKSLVYVKMIKCASTTFADILRRFVYNNGLEIVIPIKNRIYIGWPYSPKVEHILPSPDGRYDVSCEHVVYNRLFFDSIMRTGAVYVTSLRQPYKQFKSMVNYYNVLNISNVPQFQNQTLRFAHFVKNLKKYDAIYGLPESSKYRYCIPHHFSMTRNLMSFNLGFPYLTGFNASKEENVPRKTEAEEKFILKERAEAWIARMLRELDHVVLQEYFYESLVLMRRLMCWTLDDVLFIAANYLDYDYKKNSDQDAELEDIYRSWSQVDYMLYEAFNRSFWNKLSTQSADFWEEVAKLREVNQIVNTYCSSVLNSTTTTAANNDNNHHSYNHHNNNHSYNHHSYNHHNHNHNNDHNDHNDRRLVIEKSKFHDRLIYNRTTCALFNGRLLQKLFRKNYFQRRVAGTNVESNVSVEYFC